MSNDASIPELKADALAQAKKAVGGNTGLARAIGAGITSQAVSQWKQVPAERVIAVEKATGVRRSLLRPDLYPADREVAA